MPDVNIEIKERLVKSCLDLITLSLLKSSSAGEGGAYDLIAKVHRMFDVMVSPGVIYPVLFALERDGSVKTRWRERKKVYELTAKGDETIKSLQEAYLETHKKLLQTLER